MDPVRFTTPLWVWQGAAAWHFVSLPEDAADAIEFVAESEGLTRGFGSVRVAVTVGGTTWQTSVFPDSDRGTYLLPIKRAVREAEALLPGHPVDVSLEIVPGTG